MTNRTAGAEDTRAAQEPLGSMLVRRGLLTAEQLESALAEQEASGDPLGKIVELEAAYETASAGTAASPVDRWAAAERHLLFFQGSDGYELVERAGPPPASGDRVEVPGGPQIVMRLAASPAPGSELPCAYLIAA